MGAGAQPWTTRNATRRDLTVRTLCVRAETVDEEQRSIEAVLSTENPVRVFDFRTLREIDEVLIARGAQFDGQVVLLDNHFRWSNDDVLGSIRSIRVENNQVVGRLHFAAGDEAADRVWNKVRQGHITDVSIGYRSIEFVDIPPGTSRRVNGREYQAGERTLRVTTRYRIREGSVTPIGADEAAKFRTDAGLPADPPPTPSRDEATMNRALREYLESIGLRADASEADAWTFYNRLQGAQRQRAAGILEGRINPEGHRSSDPPAEPPPTAHPAAGGQRNEPPPAAPPATPPAAGQRTEADAERIRREAAEAERERIAAIRALATEETREEWIEHCVRSELTIEQAGHYILTQERAQRTPAVSGAPAGHTHSHEGGCTERSLITGLLIRTGHDPFQQFRDLQQLHAVPSSPAVERVRRSIAGMSESQLHQACDLGHRYADLSLVDLCREAVRISGATDPESGSQPYTREGFIRAAVSTPTLTNVFTTSVNARLLMSFAEAEDTSDWAASEDVADFKSHERIALGKQSGLEKLPRGTTAKHATFDDLQETYKIARYAKQFVVDEQDILDDNLSAFQTVPAEMGAAAARLRPDLVYSILLANPTLSQDSTALFHADHNNTETDTFSKANLEGAVTAMMQQTDGGVRLNLRPQYLLVPGDLEWTARELLTSAQLIIAGTEDPSVVRGNRNVITDLNLQLRVEGRIDASGVTDPASGTAYTGSATTWFLASRPGRTIVVGYRSGTGRRPALRRFILDRGQWGVGWDMNMDIGAKALGYQGLHRGNT